MLRFLLQVKSEPSWSKVASLQVFTDLQHKMVANGRMVVIFDKEANEEVERGDSWTFIGSGISSSLSDAPAVSGNDATLLQAVPTKTACFVLLQNETRKSFSINEYDLGNCKWMKEIAIPDVDQYQWVSIAGSETLLYVLGGTKSLFNCNVHKISLLAYNLETEYWQDIWKGTHNHCNSTVLVINDAIYLVGGFSELNPSNAISALDLTTLSWRSLPSSKAHAATSQAFCNGLLLTGGYENLIDSQVSSCVEYLDLRSFGWAKMPSMSQKRAGHGLCVVQNDHFVVAGGQCDSGSFLNSVETLEVYNI